MMENHRAELIEKMYTRMIAVARKQKKGQLFTDTTRDVAHKAIVKLLTLPETTWKDEAHFINYAWNTIRTTVVDNTRRASHRKRFYLDADSQNGASPDLEESLSALVEDQSLTPDTLVALETAFEQVGAQYPKGCAILRMRYLAHFKVVEIAHHLKMTPEGVRKSEKVARKFLARALKS